MHGPADKGSTIAYGRGYNYGSGEGNIKKIKNKERKHKHENVGENMWACGKGGWKWR